MIVSNIDEFNNCLENMKFVEAHEILESDWKKLRDIGYIKEAKYLKVLINGATALALYYIKRKVEGGRQVWEYYYKNKDLYNEVELYEQTKYEYSHILLEKYYKSLEDK